MKSQFVIFLILLLDSSFSNNFAETTQQQWSQDQISLTEYGKWSRKYKLWFFAADNNETVSIEMKFPPFTKNIPCKVCPNQQEEEIRSGRLSTTVE